jgi:hypothetical protein
LGYILAAFDVDGSPRAMVAYTTSQPWPGRLPQAVYAFTREQAKTMGQDRPFVLDARRIAYVPIDATWFPDLARPGHGCVGRVSEPLRVRIETAMKTLFARSPDTVERLGTFWPRPPRRR